MSNVFWYPGMTLAKAEENIIKQALKHCGDNKTHAAEMLGISIKTIYNKIETFDKEIVVEDYENKINQKNSEARAEHVKYVQSMNSGAFRKKIVDDHKLSEAKKSQAKILEEKPVELPVGKNIKADSGNKL